jgi:hypothetical protein
MKATETYLILCQMDAGEITLQEAHELILRLFGVMESDCQHDWLVDMYDNFGFPASRYCDKCDLRQSVP